MMIGMRRRTFTHFGNVHLVSWFFTYMCFIWINLTLVSCHVKLNVPRVRLPYFENLSINFTLQVDTPGCYHWTISRSDVITITYTDEDGFELEEPDCSDRAIISTVPRVSPCCPANAIVYAEEVNTKEIVRCDIIVDKINSINIVTTTKELHLEEAPSKFNVRGYGGMNNEFSTMEGVTLKWWLESHTTETSSITDPQSIMRFISFSESMYKASPAIGNLEAKRLQGSQVLVEGLKTGSANVFAKISDPLYKNIAPAQVRIVVVANLMLDPNEVYVVRGTIFPLKLLQMKHGRFINIKLPSSVYSFEVVNETVATYDKQKSLITAHLNGETKIIVTDKNTLEGSYEEHALIAYVHVREPKFLSLSIHPFRNWAVMMGQKYEISVDIYDSENLKIFIGDNIKVKTTFETMFFNIEFSSENGTYHIGTPIKSGNTRIIAELIHIRQIDGSLLTPTIAPRVQTDMNIFQRIAINPKETILPWDSNILKKHEIIFTASGGNGNFGWRSTNTSVVSVTQNGQAKIEYCGFANVSAAMTINSNIRGEAKVYVLPPTDMKIVENIVEAEVGTAILIPLAFYTIRPDDPTKKQVSYSNCKNLPFKVDVEDQFFHYDSKTHYPHAKPACVYLPILSNHLGSSLVTVTYSTPTQILTDSVIVSTFKPLKIIEPSSGVTVLAVGSSRQLVFEGGPLPLMDRSSGFFRKLLIENETVVQSYEFKPLVHSTKDDMYIFEVICKEIGETLVALHTGNSKHKDESRPVSRTAEINVICAEPDSIYFKVETTSRQEGGSKCPNDISAAQMVRIPIPNYENTMVTVIVKDTKGRKFDNITSLNIEWSSSLPLVTFSNENFISTQSVPINGYNIVGKNYQTVIPISKSGNIEIIAEIKGYRADVLRRLKIKYLQLPKRIVSDGEEYSHERIHSMDLQLVSDLTVKPSEVILFNHPSSKAVVHIVEGSGYFEVLTSGGSDLNLNYYENNRTILITPASDGYSKIIVKDLCLFTHRTTEIDVQVNGVGKIEVDAVEKLQLLHEGIVSVSLYDKSGNKLSADHLKVVNLKPNSINADILEIARVDQDKFDISRIHYKIKGKHIGISTLSFSAESPGSITQSTVKRVTVFPPLTMKPGNITILIGSVYQLISQGGPQIEALTNFSIDTPDIADISVNGLIRGKSLGRTRINARSVDRIPSRKVYSEDTVNLIVVSLRGIRIQAPLLRIQKNHEMPLWAVGIGEGLDPSILLGGNSPLVSLEWQVNNRETAEIRQIFQTNGYIPPAGDQLAVHFRAKHPGQVLVKLIANYSGTVFVDEIEVEVHDELRLLKFAINTQPLLMTPNSELNLQTNRDASALISYHVQSCRGPSCQDRAECQNQKDDKPIVTVDNNGVVRSFDVLGQAVIFISMQGQFGIIKTISVTVEVKSVSYIMINPLLPINLMQNEKSRIPTGLTFRFTVTYHDNVGTIFSSTNGLVDVRSNRFDLAQVSPGMENNTFVVQTLTEGRLSVKVYDKNNPMLTDFLILSIDEAIDPPQRFVTVGDVICFSCAIKSNDLKSGHWVIEPKEVLFLDSTNGFAVALAPGRPRLEYHIEGVGIVTSLDITVKRISQVNIVRTTQNEFITNGDPNNVYDIPITFGEKNDYLYGSDCVSELFSKDIDLPFSCEMQYENNNVAIKMSDTFSVQMVFVPGKDRYFCRIQPIKVQKYPYYVSSIRSKILLKVKVNANAVQISGGAGTPKLSHGHLESSPLALSFLPAVCFLTKELHMTNKEPYTTLYITGHLKILDQLKFISSDGSNLKVNVIGPVATNIYTMGLLADEKVASLDQMQNGQDVETRSFHVKLLDTFWLSGNVYPNLSVTVVSTLTKQKFVIPVELKLVAPFNVNRAEKSGWWGTVGFFADWGYFFLLTPCIVILTLFFTQLAYKYHLQVGAGGNTTYTNDSVFITSPKASPTYGHKTPQRSSMSPASFGDGSNLTQRLYSTQDIDYLNSGYRNLQRSSAHL